MPQGAGVDDGGDEGREGTTGQRAECDGRTGRAISGIDRRDVEGLLAVVLSRTRIIDLNEDTEWINGEPFPAIHTAHYVALTHTGVANFVRRGNLCSDAEVG